jgi:hypothetical protein
VSNGIIFPILDAPTPGALFFFVFSDVPIIENKFFGHL